MSRSPKDTQAETIRLTTPAEAVVGLDGPGGVPRPPLRRRARAVRNPIAIATDPRGRLWVAENNTYAERPTGFDLSQHDRIVVLEDTDHDGKADKRSVFWDKAQKLTSVELGFGGVWALCPPQAPVHPRPRTATTSPTASPRSSSTAGNTMRSATTSPTACGGVPTAGSTAGTASRPPRSVGAPGTPKGERVADQLLDLALPPDPQALRGRLPRRDELMGPRLGRASASCFIINTVIGHLWHGVPGAYGQRMYGEHDNPHLYALTSDQNADHYHWDRAETWDVIRKIGVSKTTDQAGGGHAHAGLMIYQGDNWPEAIPRQTLHGQPPRPATQYRHPGASKGRATSASTAPTFLKTSDPWFRRDRPDLGQRRQRLPRRLDRHRRVPRERRRPQVLGRIYKITHGDTKPPRSPTLPGRMTGS